MQGKKYYYFQVNINPIFLLGIQHDGFDQNKITLLDIIIDCQKYRFSAFDHKTFSIFNSMKTILNNSFFKSLNKEF